MTLRDHYPKSTTTPPPQEQETFHVPAAETEPTSDPRDPRSHRKRGRVATAVAGVLLVAGSAGWLGAKKLLDDDAHAGPEPDRPAATASETPGTQTEKSPEIQAELTAKTMPFYLADGEKLTGVDELNAKIASVNEGVSDPNKAFQNAMETQFGILANMNTSKEAVKAGPALAQAEQENDVIAGGVDQMFAAPDSFHQQNRDQAVEFVTSVHNSLVEDANELGTAKDWTDNLRFVVDTSSINKDGGHEARGHFVPGGMMVEASWKDYFENHIFVGNMVADGQGGLKLGGFGIFDKPTQGEN